MKKKTLVVLTKKWGRNYTGATLATQYFVDRWTFQFDRIAVFTLEIGNYDNTKQNISVLKCKNEQELLLALKEENRCDSSIVGYSDDHLGYLRIFLLKAFTLCHCIKEQLETRRQWLMSPYIWRTSQKDITANLSLYGTEWILSRVRLTAVIRKHM